MVRPSIIQVRDLTVRYENSVALDAVTLEIASGEFVLLTGPSGCGKSTLARVLNGLVPEVSPADVGGEVMVAGLDVSRHSVAALAEHVGLVFQRPAAQLFCLTVEEEIASGPRNLGLDETEIAARVKWALSAVGVGHLRQRRISTLSGGEQQRVAIAAVLAMRPAVLVLDEPTSHLDFTGTNLVLATLKGLQQAHGLTVLVIEHRLAEVAPLAERVLLMDRGRIVADGPPADVFGRRELLARLGVRFPWHILDGRITSGLASASHQLGATGVESAGKSWPAVLPRGFDTLLRNDPPLVRLTGIAAGYGRETVLNDLDLALYRGEFVALVGENGVGKSTVGKLLAGLLKPRRGTITWPGRPHRRWPLRSATRPKVGFVLQDPKVQLFCDTVGEEVAFGPRNFGRYSEAHLAAVLAAADLTALQARRIHALSCGQQQRTALAASMALTPDLLIVDEPTLGQDWGHLSRLMAYLVALNQQGKTVLIITHDYKVVCRYVRRILVLRDGRIIADGPPRLPVRIEHAAPMLEGVER